MLTLLVLNLFYGFTGTLRPLGDFRFVSESFACADAVAAVSSAPAADDCPECDEQAAERLAALPAASVSGKPTGPVTPGNRYTGSWLGSVPVPLPENFLQGIDIQARDFERGWYDAGWQSYLLGEWKQGGWWYYYLVGLAVKVPLAIWLLVAVSTIASFVWRPGSGTGLGIAVLLVPAIIFFVFVSSATGLNRYVRYALPVLPVLIVWAASVGRLLTAGDDASAAALSAGRRKLVGGVTAAACLWLAVVSIDHNPNHLSYFNELAGGPENGHKILCDSNIDWGQDLIALERWLEKNPAAKRDFHLAYFGSYSPASVGIKPRLPPEFRADSRDRLYADQLWLGPQPGWHVVSKNYSVGHLMPLLNPRGFRSHSYTGEPVYQYFEMFQPVSRIGQSMLVYHLSPDDVAQARRLLGLAPLPGIRPSEQITSFASN